MSIVSFNCHGIKNYNVNCFPVPDILFFCETWAHNDNWRSSIHLRHAHAGAGGGGARSREAVWRTFTVRGQKNRFEYRPLLS